TKTGLASSAIRHMICSECWSIIDHDATDVDTASSFESEIDILCENSCLKSISFVVDSFQGFIEILVLHDRYDRSEYFLTNHEHLRFRVGQNNGLDQIVLEFLPSGQNL